MAKAQHCPDVCRRTLQMSNYGEPADGNWPPMIEHDKYGTLIICPAVRRSTSPLSTTPPAIHRCGAFGCSSPASRARAQTQCPAEVCACMARYSGSKKNWASPPAGLRWSSQVASGSNLAKNGRWTQSALRPWIKRRTKTFSPFISVMPCTSTLPGPALMDGPRAVRARPETWKWPHDKSPRRGPAAPQNSAAPRYRAQRTYSTG